MSRSSVSTPARWSTRLPLLASVAISVVFVARSTFRVRGAVYFSLFDDATVSMRYARNLAHGAGLVWNPHGAHVEGYTNFLWTLWMAVLHLVGVPDRFVGGLVSASGAALLVANLLVVRAITRRLVPDSAFAAALAMWLVALCYPLVYWTLRGMEVGLLAFLGSAAALFAMRCCDDCRGRDLAILASVLALGVLTRSDFVVPAAIVAGFVALRAPPARRRRAAAVLVGVIAATLVAHTAFRVYYYGDPLPNTYYLKLQGFAVTTRMWRGVAALANDAVVELALPLAFAALALWRRRGPLAPVQLVIGIFLGQVAYSAFVGGDAWEWMQYANRYVTTGLPALLVVTALGVDDVRRHGLSCRGWLVLAVLSAGIAGIAAAERLPGRDVFPLNPAVDVTGTLLIVATGAAIAFVLASRWVGREQAWSRPAAGWLLGALVIVVAAAPASARWASTGGEHVRRDIRLSRFGLDLRTLTAPRATIAVGAAGALPYWADRDAVDLLGKSDPHVARGPARKVPFAPGHSKWDYRYSVCRLRPDLVTDLRTDSLADIHAVESCGYTRVKGGLFVRSDTVLVDRPGLDRLLARVDPP